MVDILQISDPHLMSQRQATLKGVPTAASLANVLEEARLRCPDPARIVWTGDLSHEETSAGYRLLSEIAGDWIDRSLVIPGNHDDRAALREVYPEIEGRGDQFVSFRTELDHWLLIGIDTHVPGDAAGKLSQAQLDRLHDWLATDPGRPTLVFMHHPPIPIGCSWLDGIALRDPTQLETLLSSSPGLRGIFCGHVHQEHQGSFAGVPVFTTPAAAFQFEGGCPVVSFDMVPPGFRLVSLDGDQFSTEVFRCRELAYRPGEH